MLMIHRPSVVATLVLLASSALPGCGSSETAPSTATDTAAEEASATAAVKKTIETNLDVLVAAAAELQAAAPAPDGDGWNSVADRAQVAAMQKAWQRGRDAYERVEGAIAVLFPELDVSTDERYEGFLLVKPDDNLFDDEGVTGNHAIERILWSDTTPKVVIAFESKLPGYRKAAFPANEKEARDFKEKLCGRFVAETRKMRDQFKPLSLDLAAAFHGIIGSQAEQVEKVNKAATGAEESRYAQRTLADMRANVDGGQAIYVAFRPWLLKKPNGPHVDEEITSAFGRVKAHYATLSGDALPSVPPTWSMTPSAMDLATPYGKIFTLLDHESDEKTDGTLVFDMKEAASLLGLASAK